MSQNWPSRCGPFVKKAFWNYSLVTTKAVWKIWGKICVGKLYNPQLHVKFYLNLELKVNLKFLLRKLSLLVIQRHFSFSMLKRFCEKFCSELKFQQKFLLVENTFIWNKAKKIWILLSGKITLNVVLWKKNDGRNAPAGLSSKLGKLKFAVTAAAI